jgi:type I restriction enzyme S subunit
MSSSGFNYEECRYIPISEEVAAGLAIREGDFFVSRGNGSLRLLGRGTLAQIPPGIVVFPDTMIRLRFSRLECLPRFMSVAWESRHIRRQVEGEARTTAGIYKISQGDIEAFHVPLAPLPEQEEILLEVERRLSIVNEAEAQVDANLKRAARLRQSILKRAFEGRLVPQDPADESANKLLERIRQERAAANGSVAPRTRRGRTSRQQAEGETHGAGS